MKKDNAGNEALQGKITEYETKMATLAAELEQTKIDAAIKIALLEAKADDVDYLTFKLKEQGEQKLDDNGKVKGINDSIVALKTQFPKQFIAEQGKKIDENKLPENDGEQNVEPQTLADALKVAYETKN